MNIADVNNRIQEVWKNSGTFLASTISTKDLLKPWDNTFDYSDEKMSEWIQNSTDESIKTANTKHLSMNWSILDQHKEPTFFMFPSAGRALCRHFAYLVEPNTIMLRRVIQASAIDQSSNSNLLSKHYEMASRPTDAKWAEIQTAKENMNKNQNSEVKTLGFSESAWIGFICADKSVGEKKDSYSSYKDLMRYKGKDGKMELPLIEYNFKGGTLELNCYAIAILEKTGTDFTLTF